MDVRAEKAFAFAQDLTKQLITLATGVITVTITFRKEVLGDAAGEGKAWLAAGWGAEMLSVACGVWVLMAMTGALGTSQPRGETSVYGTSIRVPAVLQVAGFVVGLALILASGVATL